VVGIDRLSDYHYELPESLIAQTPLADRAASRLLHLPRDGGAVQHRQFRDVLSVLRTGDLLVVNDTRVSAIRLQGRKSTGAAVEALLLAEIAPGVYRALVKPGKRLHVGAVVEFEGGLSAQVQDEGADGQRDLAFGDSAEVQERLRNAGTVPLPPYIHEVLDDPERYQTVYSSHDGSAAAPTAGLHFTPEILSALEAQGVRLARVTLHVGIDTFRPVSVDDLDEHIMHGEVLQVPEETVAAVTSCTGRVIAVGTTTVRTLETMAIGKRQLRAGSEVSRLFIRPGFEFKIVDGMFTNFHLPGTTMMMMLAGMVGRERLLAAYAEAVHEEYRFLSFGDSMLIL
jgi:S-adenosylmethionine:tRNA ribosyltransferase-isomerase